MAEKDDAEVQRYPMMIYKGKGLEAQTMVVNDEKEERKAFSDGWFKTPKEAADAIPDAPPAPELPPYEAMVEQVTKLTDAVADLTGRLEALEKAADDGKSKGGKK